MRALEVEDEKESAIRQIDRIMAIYQNEGPPAKQKKAIEKELSDMCKQEPALMIEQTLKKQALLKLVEGKLEKPAINFLISEVNKLNDAGLQKEFDTAKSSKKLPPLLNLHTKIELKKLTNQLNEFSELKESLDEFKKEVKSPSHATALRDAPLKNIIPFLINNPALTKIIFDQRSEDIAQDPQALLDLFEAKAHSSELQASIKISRLLQQKMQEAVSDAIQLALKNPHNAGELSPALQKMVDEKKNENEKSKQALFEKLKGPPPENLKELFKTSNLQYLVDAMREYPELQKHASTVFQLRAIEIGKNADILVSVLKTFAFENAVKQSNLVEELIHAPVGEWDRQRANELLANDNDAEGELRKLRNHVRTRYYQGIQPNRAEYDAFNPDASKKDPVKYLIDTPEPAALFFQKPEFQKMLFDSPSLIAKMVIMGNKNLLTTMEKYDIFKNLDDHSKQIIEEIQAIQVALKNPILKKQLPDKIATEVSNEVGRLRGELLFLPMDFTLEHAQQIKAGVDAVVQKAEAADAAMSKKDLPEASPVSTFRKTTQSTQLRRSTFKLGLRPQKPIAEQQEPAAPRPVATTLPPKNWDKVLRADKSKHTAEKQSSQAAKTSPPNSPRKPTEISLSDSAPPSTTSSNTSSPSTSPATPRKGGLNPKRMSGGGFSIH